MLVHQFSEFFAHSFPEKPCVRLDDQALNCKEFDDHVNRLANGMLSLGVQPAQRISILGENSVEHGVLTVATSKIGAVLVPLNYRLAPAELGYIISDSQTKVLVVLESAQALLTALRAHLPADITIVTTSADDSLNWDDWLGQFDTVAPSIEVDRDAPFLQLYTSGTTGNPKGVVSSQHSIMNTSIMNTLQTSIRPDVGSATIVMAPLFHIGGLGSLIAGIINCQSIIIHQVFDPIKLLDDIEQHPIQAVFMVPAMIQFLLQVPGIEKRNFSDLKQIGYGASPISEPVLRQAIDVFQADFTQMYGMTETAGFGVRLTQNDHAKALNGRPELLKSCGRAAMGAAIKVVDAHGNEVERGETGEVWLKSASNMLSYFNLEEATASNLTDGWVHTGDAGYLDEEGYLFLKDRIKDMVVSGGENIYPSEVEHALINHPSIADVSVLGVPDEKYGEALLAVLVLVPETSVTIDEVVEFCRDKIAGYKIPRQIQMIDELPRNPSGKVLKKELRAPYWDGLDRSIG